jgi:predicted Zn-ribbon and HTH transcriptional regulator
VTFPEFVQSQEAFNDLALGEHAAREAFYKWQQYADLEFLDASAEKMAENIDGHWLLCPACCDAWEFESPDAMVRCPKCHSILRNPKIQSGCDTPK